ncbi:MAG: PadR family transcriptional regulator, partial [Candidatus Thermoplasmatota archaeon]
MDRGALVAPTFPFLARGRFRILLLRTLEDQPMHGYEVMKVLEERFQGFYKPSAGAIYPALRSLLREGYVAVNGAERRKTYRIMPKGRAFLRSHEADMEKRFRAFESAVGSERASLFRELRTTGKLLGANLKSITPDQADDALNAIYRRFDIKFRDGVILKNIAGFVVIDGLDASGEEHAFVLGPD